MDYANRSLSNTKRIAVPPPQPAHPAHPNPAHPSRISTRFLDVVHGGGGEGVDVGKFSHVANAPAVSSSGGISMCHAAVHREEIGSETQSSKESVCESRE